MLNNYTPNNYNRKQPKLIKKKIGLPHLSLDLHVMPKSNEQHFQKWTIWGAIIFVLLIILSYFLFK